MFRLLKFAWQNFSRNIWLSLVTVIIIVLSLFLINSLIVLGVLANQSLNYYKSKVDISVFLKPEVTENQALLIKEKLLNVTEIKEIQYKTKAQSLEELKDRYKNNPLFLESLKELENNPLGETLIVKLKNIEDYPKVLSVLQSKDYQDSIEMNFNIFGDVKKVINKLDNITQKVYQIEFIASLIFGFIVFLLIFNAIRLTIYNHKEEIAIMRLVGASSWFIRGPFLLESIFYGFFAWLINLGLLALILKFIQPYIAQFLDHYQFDIISYFGQNFLAIFGWQLLIIVFISIVSSMVAMHKYLRV